jgi:hypothetical protein
VSNINLNQSVEQAAATLETEIRHLSVQDIFEAGTNLLTMAQARKERYP